MTQASTVGLSFPDLTIAEAFTPASSPRRILVYAPLAYSTPHFETDLEIAQRHLDLGDEVELMLCDAELSSCQLNPTRDPMRCAQCVSRNLQGSAQLSVKVRVRGLLAALTPADSTRLAEIPSLFTDQAKLRNYSFDSFDAGMAALSSIIDFARSLTIDTQRLAPLIHNTLHAAVASYLAMKRVLAATHYDRVYVYNGRWSTVRSAVRACEEAGVSYYTHERGSDFRKFSFFHNTLPHDKAYTSRRALAAWENAQHRPEAVAIAEAFFHERRQRVEKSWFSFIKGQEKGRVPDDWNKDLRRLVLFTSSEFEFAAIGEASSGRIYPTQAEGARRISHRLGELEPRTHLWIRVHPNDSSPAAVKWWKDAVAPLRNVTLILPDATVDSYAMLDGADRIVTFGSTIGVEATFWGKPGICADNSFFDGLDAQYEAQTEAELFELLTRPELPPKPRAHALRYSFYVNSHGAEFVHFSTATISDYEFKSPFRSRCLKPDYDDLRQRLLNLYQTGDLRRARLVSKLCIELKPEDGMAHSIQILSQLKPDTLLGAIQSLEYAATKTSPPHFEQILAATGKALLDSIMQFGTHATATDFKALAVRTGQVMRRAAAYAALGQKLIGLAQRATAPSSTEVVTTGSA